jgi:hypothetical protein
MKTLLREINKVMIVVQLHPEPSDAGNGTVETESHLIITDYAVVDRIINHLKLTFVAERPPPPHMVYQEVLMAAEAGGEYLS